MKNYFKHLLLNWKVALHSLNDFAEHFIHGLLPFISWKHYHIDYDDGIINEKENIEYAKKMLKQQVEDRSKYVRIKGKN